MEKQTEAAKPSLFPSQRPTIVITESTETPFAVDCPELRWWSIVPRIGEKASWAAYNPPDWVLSDTAEMQVVCTATVHDVEGVEIEVRPWKSETGWEPAWTMYGRLTEQKAQYLGTVMPHDGTVRVNTFLDEDFTVDWGELDRLLEDRGRFEQEGEGSLKRNLLATDSTANGAGIFCVEIGGKTFSCLRVLETVDDLDAEAATLTESYVTREGRTLLTRHYCDAHFPEVAQFEVVVDKTKQLLLDGTVFFHWYDTVTSLAL